MAHTAADLGEGIKMASLYEILNAQRRERHPTERPNTFARVAESILLGSAAGSDAKARAEEARMKHESDSLERYVKILDIQEKVNKAQAERENLNYVRNAAKAMGLLPQDEGDEMTGRALSAGAMSVPESERKSEVTNVGKMNKMFEDYAPTVTMGKNGMSMSFRKKIKSKPGTMSPTQAASFARDREAMAKQIYNRDHPERQTKDMMDRPIAYNPTSAELQESGAYIAADSLLKNYMGGFDQYVDEHRRR
jgi:hypothetical protein